MSKEQAEARQGFLENLLYRALGEPLGLLLRSETPDKARNALYAARTKCGDEDLARLQFRLVELDGGNLAIVKGAYFPSESHALLTPAAIPSLKDIDL